MSGKTIYANNWEYSSIRTWLNNTFYKTAFDSLAQSVIQTTYLDNKNSATLSTTEKTEKYVKSQNNTYDKIFLLSRGDLRNTNYGFSTYPADYTRQICVNDYGKTIGLYVSAGTGGLIPEKQGAGSWLTRSPGYRGEDDLVGYIQTSGQITANVKSATVLGIVPSLWITL